MKGNKSPALETFHLDQNKIIRFVYHDSSGEYRMSYQEEIKPLCKCCGKEIKGEKPYFCPILNYLYHKKCLIADDRHWQRVNSKGVHSDHPITLKFINTNPLTKVLSLIF